MKNTFLILVITLFSVWSAFAGDAYNKNVVITENYDQVSIQFNDAIGTDSTGSIHSKPIYIGDCNDGLAYALAICNAASDINIIFHYSYDRRVWTSVNKHDQVSNAAKYDSCATNKTGDFRFNDLRWLIIEKDGQTGANVSDICYFTLLLQKDAYPVNKDGFPVKVCFTADGSIVDP